jgi:hypothetical protein
MIHFTYIPTDDEVFPFVFYDNKVVNATITASTSATGAPAANVATTSTFDFWSPTSGTATLTFDLGQTFDVDTISIVAHDLGTKGATVTIQDSLDGSTWVDRAVISPEDNSTITVLLAKFNKRYWRLSIVAANPVVIGNVLIGERLVFPAGVRPPYTPTHMADMVELLFSETLDGQFITNRPVRYGIETTATLNAVEYGFVEGNLADFRKHYNDGKPFIWASCPKFVEKDTAYVWRDANASTLKPTFDQNGNFMNVEMELRGYRG